MGIAPLIVSCWHKIRNLVIEVRADSSFDLEAAVQEPLRSPSPRSTGTALTWKTCALRASISST
jgi:hypothetical protein